MVGIIGIWMQMFFAFHWIRWHLTTESAKISRQLQREIALQWKKIFKNKISCGVIMFISTIRCSIPPPTRRSIHPSIQSTYRFGCFKPFYGNLHQLRQTKTGHLRPSETIRDHCIPLNTIEYHWIPMNTIEYNWKPLNTIECQDHPRPGHTRTDKDRPGQKSLGHFGEILGKSCGNLGKF